ncbi:MAG: ComF family protein [Pseudomonadota bacterium]
MGLRSQPCLCAACLQNPGPLDAMLVAASYEYPWSGLIANYKFGEQPGWAGFFAYLLLTTPGVRAALETLETHDLIIPVPLSARRLQTRGFNQAWELAAALARRSGTRAKADAGLLLRVKDTQPQTELKRAARLANVRGAFQVDPLRISMLQGRRVLLVDDVITSGASLFTAAQALRVAGVMHITGIAIAKTEQH